MIREIGARTFVMEAEDVPTLFRLIANFMEAVDDGYSTVLVGADFDMDRSGTWTARVTVDAIWDPEAALLEISAAFPDRDVEVLQ